MIRRHADGSIRFTGKDAEAERLAVRALMAERHDREERLHAEHMRLLGEAVEPTGTREVLHVVGTRARRSCGRLGALTRVTELS